MGNPFYEFINKVYTNKEYKWLENFYDKVNGIALISVLAKDDQSLKYLKKISKYVYALRNDYLLIFIHSIIPKRYKAPWMNYRKKKKEEKIDRLHIKIQKYFKYSDSEYGKVKSHIEFFIRRDLESYYIKFGINK